MDASMLREMWCTTSIQTGGAADMIRTLKAFAIFALAGYLGLLILSERAIRYLT